MAVVSAQLLRGGRRPAAARLPRWQQVARFPGGHLHLQLSVLFAALHILRAGCRGLSPEGERHTGPQQRAGGSREHRGALWALPDQGKAWGSWDGVTCRVLRNGCWGHLTVAGREASQPGESQRAEGPGLPRLPGRPPPPSTHGHVAGFVSSWPLAASGIILLTCLFTSSLSVFCPKS